MKTYQHFKKLNEIRKEEGLKSALEYDVVQTLKRHPKLGGLVLALALNFSEHKPEPNVCVDEVVGDDGQYLHVVSSRVPASTALGNRQLSRAAYDQIMEGQR